MDLNAYKRFVESVTSSESNSLRAFKDRIDELAEKSLSFDPAINLPLLLTASAGLAAEGGEFGEVVKKIFFQGKPLDDDNIFHLKRELGDILWYWVNGCRALGLDPDEVLLENVRKLESRYPGGEFDAFFSENRKEDDL
jgi:NTP pyrophosphatase (non-canonical NTP hydrolase)